MEKKFLDLIAKIKMVDDGKLYRKLVFESELTKQEEKLLMYIKILRDYVRLSKEEDIKDSIQSSFDSGLRTAIKIVEEYNGMK
ncbi:MAG: hypothetical protein IJS90_04335 [Clostridia bacterium]|nr:hypothetical protein [Clostridia bacterium]